MTIPGSPESHLPSPSDNVAPADHQEPPTGPVPVATVSSTASEATWRTRRQTPILLGVIGVLVVALGVVTALWISTSNQLSAFEASQAAVEADRAATPDLLDVAQRNLGATAIVTGDSGSVSIVIFESSMSRAAPGLRSMLGELGFSSAVLDRMGNTRALDGTREAQGKNCNVTWTFHPDDGLQMVFEAVQPG